MAATTALHPLRSEESTSASAKSARVRKASGEFQKKLATATRHTSSKPVVVELTKKSASKPAADEEGSRDDAEKEGSGAAEAIEEDKPVLATEKSAVTPLKTKPAADKATDTATDSEKPVATPAHREVAAIHPDGRQSQPRQQSQGKAKSQNSTAVAGVETPLAMNPAVNAPSQSNGSNSADDDADLQATAKITQATDSNGPVDLDSQLASQPTFGAAQPDEHPAVSDSDSSDQNAPSAAESAASDSTGDSGGSAATGTFAEAIADAVGSARTSSTDSHVAPTTVDPQAIGAGAQTTSTQQAAQAAKTTASVATTAQARFVEDNHPKIVTGISGQLMPKGGTMSLRLDPPGLGQMQVTVRLREGSMSAEFETSSDEATRMLSHSLGQLKSSLETAGMTVEKLHVEQSPKKDGQSQNDSDAQTAPHEQQQQAQQEKQRREMMQRMWAKLAGDDDLDMVA